MILVDTNVLADIASNDPVWLEWSRGQLDAAILRDRLAINPVVYAELSNIFAQPEELDVFLDGSAVNVVEVPKPALFLAGRAFLTYRQRGGVRTGVLPDFFIGAHAAVLGAPLITRDPRRYKSYFPSIELIAPDQRRLPPAG